MKDEFEKLNELYGAIKEVDKLLVTEGSQKDRFDNLVTAIKNIDRNKFPEEYLTSIILYVKAALCQNYNDILEVLNSSISFPTEQVTIPPTKGTN